MKPYYLAPFLILAFIIALCIGFYQLGQQSVSNKELQLKYDALEKHSTRLKDQINLLSSEIHSLETLKSVEHEQRMEAEASAIIYQRKYLLRRDAKAAVYSNAQIDSVLRALSGLRKSK